MLRLRPPRPDDEDAVRLAHTQEMGEFGFTLNFDVDEPFVDWVDRCERYARGIDVPDHLVPAAFLLAEVDGEVVGRSSIRFELNDFLERQGGHIGYGVRPQFRGKGYATEMLRQSLVIARSRGVDDVLIFCDDDNIGSRTVIERCGGEFQRLVHLDDEPMPMRRYLIR